MLSFGMEYDGGGVLRSWVIFGMSQEVGSSFIEMKSIVSVLEVLFEE